MTAAVTTRHGGLDAIEIREDWPAPRPAAGELLVRVTAAALNNTDIWSREGAYGTAADPDAIAGWKGVPLAFPLIQGIDVAGEVRAVGDGVDADWTGRRVLVDPTVEYDGDFPRDVIGSEVDGGFAQLHVCPVDRAHDVSDSPLTDAQLSCLPTAFGTALGMINRGGCRPGDRVLVTGASGGVGGAAVQMLAHRGCQVIARTSATAVPLVTGDGAVSVSIRGRDAISALPEVDVVIDVVGGSEFSELVDRVRDGGRLVTAGAVAGPIVSLDLRRIYLRQRRLIGSTMHTPADFVELAEIANVGGVNPRVAATFPLVELHAAQRRFLQRDVVGKVVVLP